jgi:ATP-dependent exoDNAse (exonuclease V) beta subunit
VTFSDKAAGELRDRVRRRLEALAARPREDFALEEAYRRLRLKPLAAADWRAAREAAFSAPITTYHGWTSGLLRRHAAAAGLDPAFRLLEDDEARTLLRASCGEVVLASLADPDVRALVRELDYTRGVDGRGRGLIEHLVAVAEKLREDGRPAGSLAVDDAGAARAVFAAAAADYQAAFDELRAALGGKLADRAARLADLRPGVDEALADVDRDPFAHPALPLTHDLAYGNLGTPARNAAKRRLYDAEDAVRAAHVAVRAEPIARAFLRLCDAGLAGYAAEKRVRDALDFADLLAHARDLLRDHAGVRREEQERHDAVLVDEFQDTNPLQDELVALARGADAPLLVVGDPKQSIYEFRGADVAVFEQAAARAAAAGGAVVALTESRRGQAPVLDFVNRLFASAMRGGEHPFEIAFSPEHDALRPHRGDGGGGVDLLAGGDAEEVLVARHARALVDGGRAFVYDKDGTGPRPPRWRDVAMLLRRFTHLDRFLAALRREGVPHYVVRGRGFFEAQEVRDLVSALVLLDEPDDALALLGVLRSPLVGLSDPSLLALADAAGGRLSLAPLLRGAADDVAALRADERARLADFLALYRRLARHADRLGAGGTLEVLVAATDLRAVLATTFYGEQRVANLDALVALAKAHDGTGQGDRHRFVRRLRGEAAREKSLAAPAQILGEDEDVVRVMTVHQAKGLEFPVVFVPECGAPEREPGHSIVFDRAVGVGMKLRLHDGARVASPVARRADETLRARAQAESMRLFYVAATRARDLLVLSGESADRSRSWRTEVDSLLAGDAVARALVRTVVPAASPSPARPAARATTPPEPAGVALGPPRAGARRVVLPAVEVADAVLCARRHHLVHDVGLGDPARDASERAAPGAAERGSAAHRVLERIDFARGPAHLDELLDAEPDAPALRPRLRAFLDTPFARSLGALPAAELLREAPFVLAAGDEPRLLVKGKLDVCIVPATGPVTVLDYKLGARRADAAYRVQLSVYAAAARALFGRPVRVGLVFLGDDDPTPEVEDVPDAELDALLARLGEVAAEIAEGRRTGVFPPCACGGCTA